MSEKPSSAQKPSEPGTIRYVNLYEADDKIYTRRITGFYQRLRRYTGIPLMLGFLLMPWLVIDGRPAMLFDLPARKFHVLWLTFWPQDAMYLAIRLGRTVIDLLLRLEPVLGWVVLFGLALLPQVVCFAQLPNR